MRAVRLFFRIKAKLRISENIKRRVVRYSMEYEIPGSTNLNWNPVYISSKNFPHFQSSLEIFKANLVEEIKSKKSISYLKFGDGDYFFLTGKPVGSAAPGKRALSRALTSTELSKYATNSKKVDKYLCEIDPQNRKYFNELFESIEPIPAEFVYGLTANHWLTKLPFKIGIIGADRKIQIVKQLMTFPEYQNYLGLEKFTDYIQVPQKFACDNLSLRLAELETQILNSEAEIFLVGVGHLKSGILSEIVKMKKAVYLDIGSGVDALAGLIDGKRPYFGSWVNHRVKNENIYEGVDLLQYESNTTHFLN